ncbi:hypothetical protein COT51_00665 [candidate division WWE3 bacterium CG08_land_8_20_14_0_20_41_15]|uniref:TrpR like protein, YerC/YecD n=1 Tax=candidate division WWE3 bacterium CG08_land_8_20_14_0_20_41_15 TaxID=1975086 RepID=A0A2H0XA79_UNCKA|nr:MAG: hypothetical protein COT51_00665 [candidate division WWE3 bacterium CG08_land_8_20_14_0_20_41_15]
MGTVKLNKFKGLSTEDQKDLVFDLINAFSSVKGPFDTLLILQDLLTAYEIKNLSKRLRIAKMIIAGEGYDNICKRLKTSKATIATVKVWLSESGEGFRRIISRLPKRKEKYVAKPFKSKGGMFYDPFDLGLSLILNKLEKDEQKILSDFLTNMESKEFNTQLIRENNEEEFKKHI